MAFEGGPVRVVALSPTKLVKTSNNLASEIASQEWKGVGQVFPGQSGQVMGGEFSQSLVNVAVSPVLGSAVSRGAGRTVLASTLTPLLSNSIASAVNQNISQSLKSAGSFGNLFSKAASSLASSAVAPVIQNLSGGSGGQGTADYGGRAYTLSDITFSLRPANAGPQSSGLQSSSSLPKNLTSVPFNQATKMSLTSPNDTANIMKSAAVGGDTYKSAWSANIPLSFF